MKDLKFSSSVRQERHFISTNVGNTVTLRCFYEGDPVRLYWYKQTLGLEPRLISTFYKYERNGTFYNEFKSNSRFTLETGDDSGTYYCASSYTFIFEFAKGTVSVKGSDLNIQALVRQSESETIKPESFSCWDLLLCCCLMWTHTVWKWDQAGH
uniref:Ig-like domain-containing protein n=1 Tax=Lates calcarifer TaxID=8187 RepID=A0A4W6CUX0_LATCA